MKTPEVTVVTITPEMASEMLDHNSHNRNVRRQVVDMYARDMEHGNWLMNGESLKITDTGEVIDGQHRLMACIKALTPFTTVLVSGIGMDVQETIDGGAKRSYGDALRLRGEINCNQLAAVVLRIFVMEARGYEQAFYPGRMSATVAELDSTLEKHPELRAVTHRSMAVSGKVPVLTGTTTAAMMYVFDRISREDSEAFWHKLVHGENLPSDDAIFVLRRTLLTMASNRSTSVTARHMGALTTKAWNRWRDGISTGVLIFRAGGANPEQYPEPH